MTTVYIDGIDKTGKSQLATYLRWMSNWEIIPVDRGPISSCIMAKKSEDESKDVFRQYVNSVCVFLEVDDEDWKIRCIHTNETMINSAIFTGAWNKHCELAKECGMTIFDYNTTQLTPYNIAKDVIQKIEDLKKNG